MGELLGLAVSQSSLLLLPHSSNFGFRTSLAPSAVLRLRGNYKRFFVSSGNRNHSLKQIVASRALASDPGESTIVTDNVNLASEGIEIEERSGGGGDGYEEIGGGGRGGEGGRGKGGGGGDGDRDKEGEGGSSEDSGGKKKMALSMSQKLTLGYAALVGMGGLMGYLKSGSQKSLISGGISAAVLYYVYTQLPGNPIYASSIGLGISAALTGVMGSRFMKSGKVFPAGVVSLVSLIMTGGYVHGIMRSMH
ncbi:hypothetical protein K2173_016049 [Erythroxylum novogranatense]|uniref:Uncharacterized protein n=1 Tax=Erythroxylum novogranatense TaxID=1862640 RepID=A0AAV8SFC1_9ROSI|nr:hypothetical protein K2173_016049 [Erythroxylum novogranatense]